MRLGCIVLGLLVAGDRDVSTCTPRLTWLKRVTSNGGDKWRIEKTDEGVCVVE